MLGLQPGIVRLVAYTSDWHFLFLEEETRLRQAIGQWAVDIQHIGSTSIPNLVAKPLLDVGVALARYEDGYQCIEPLQQLGYEYRGARDIAGRHYFVKGRPSTHHIHMFEQSHEAWMNYLVFRDYLRAHPTVAQTYGTLKRQLAAQFAHDRVAYQQGKAPFIQHILQQIKQERGPVP
jgi:GrpB-like predicted nucleotidyltransferase (UPF0157 family)